MTTATAPIIDPQPLLLDVSNTTLTVTPEQFDLLCIDNPDLRLELTPDLKLIVMAPTGGESGKKNSKLNLRVGLWNEQTELGEVFDSSTGYDLTAFEGGKPSPDVSWIEKSRLEGVNIIGLIPIVPDFVIELRSLEKVLHLGKPQDRTFRSATDSLSATKTKMEQYQRVGVRLGLLVDPKNNQLGETHAEASSARFHPQVEVYRPGHEPEILVDPKLIDCSEVMPGFILDMSKVW